MKKTFQDTNLQKLLEEKGYVKLQMLNDAEVAELRDFYERTNFKRPENDFFSTMHVADPAYRKAVDDHIKSVINPYVEKLMIDHKILFANYLYKKPASDSLVGIHQDWTYVDEDIHQSVNMWIPMIDTNVQNGGLKIIEGSHKLTTPVRYTPFEEPAYKESLELIENKALSQPVLKGEAFIYYSNLIHFSTPNISNKDRLSINMVIIPRDAQPIHFHKSDGQVEKYLVDKSFYLNYRLFEKPRGYAKESSFHYVDQCFTKEELLNL